MDEASGIDERLGLRWRDDELRGTLPRRPATQVVDSYVDTAVGLLVVFVAGVAVPGAMTSLMVEAGIAGWPFPALIAAVVMAGVAGLGLNLALRVATHGVEAWLGVPPWHFVLTPTHLVWSGAEPSREWVPGASPFRPTLRLPFTGRRLLLALTEIEALDPAAPGLQIELVSGETLFLDVDPTVAHDDLDALCAFVMDRAQSARRRVEGRRATTREARDALGRLPERAQEITAR